MVVDVPLPGDFCQLLSTTMSYMLDRALFCLTAFLATVGSFKNVGWGIRPVVAQEYLLGLGKPESPGETSGCKLFMKFNRYRRYYWVGCSPMASFLFFC